MSVTSMLLRQFKRQRNKRRKDCAVEILPERRAAICGQGDLEAAFDFEGKGRKVKGADSTIPPRIHVESNSGDLAQHLSG